MFRRYDMRCKMMFRHAIFKHTFITVDSKSVLADKIGALKAKIDELTQIELAKLPYYKRPSHYDDFMGDNWYDESIDDFEWPSGMPAPEGWMYYDDDLIKQLDKLWKKYGEAGDVVGA
jgi:hypothetical protein